MGCKTVMSETKDRPLTNIHNVDKQPAKQFRESDAHLIHQPHCDTLVIIAMMTNNNVHRILVDNGSLVDILYY